MTRIITLLSDESGATSIEYALIAMLVSVGILSAVMSLAGGVGALFGSIATSIASI